MSKPIKWDQSDLLRLSKDDTLLWCTPSCKQIVSSLLPFNEGAHFQPLNEQIRNLVVIGGGTLLDQAKVWRLEQSTKINLIVIPSIWGSGAEVSPICVLNDGDTKKIIMGSEYLPDYYLILNELAGSIPQQRATLACGDAWSHALEGFLSPLSTPELQAELAQVIKDMLETGLGNNSHWFELSGRACLLQSKASVGLVHGIAHTLEPVLTNKFGSSWGHACLCSNFLLPVMAFNQQSSSKYDDYMEKYNLDKDAIKSVLMDLFNRASFEEAMPDLIECWQTIIRDPCSRTNSVLVRPKSISFFENGSFI